MSNVPVSEKTHSKIKELCIEVGYPIKKNITQDDIVNLMIESTSVDELIKTWKIKNIEGYKTESSVNSYSNDVETDELDEAEI